MKCKLFINLLSFTHVSTYKNVIGEACGGDDIYIYPFIYFKGFFYLKRVI